MADAVHCPYVYTTALWLMLYTALMCTLLPLWLMLYTALMADAVHCTAIMADGGADGEELLLELGGWKGKM